jgi:hypothetical protein
LPISATETVQSLCRMLRILMSMASSIHNSWKNIVPRPRKAE